MSTDKIELSRTKSTNLRQTTYQSIGSNETNTRTGNKTKTRNRTKTRNKTRTRTRTRLSRSQVFANPHSHFGDGGFRAAILGFGDGLISNLLLIIGVRFASDDPSHLVITGFEGLVASSFSMCVGEWISMKNQSEALKAEAITEANHLKKYWKQESEHLMEILGEHGISLKTQQLIEKDLRNAPLDKVVNFHLMMEMGIDPNDTGNPMKAALFSFIFVGTGALVPIIPYMFLNVKTATTISLIVCGIAAIVSGLVQGTISGANLFKATIRQVLGIVIATGLAVLISIYLLSKLI
eukprot:240452_1